MRGALGLDQDDRVGHGVCVSPRLQDDDLGESALSTSVLNAWASVSIGGNVS